MNLANSPRNPHTASMTAYLVRVRIPDIGPDKIGATSLFIANVATEAEAMQKVRMQVPHHWTVDDVVGVALPSVVERRRILPGQVHQL